MKKSLLSKGFTLIELLVVIAIIGVLSSVVLASLNTARAKARDARAKSDFRQIQTAFALYYNTYGLLPNAPAPAGPGLFGASPWIANFNDMAAELVAEGFLPAVPVPPANHTYGYYNYGASSSGNNGTPIGGLLVTTLEAASDSTGYPGSCRPWTSDIVNWCTEASNKMYCICNPH